MDFMNTCTKYCGSKSKSSLFTSITIDGKTNSKKHGIYIMHESQLKGDINRKHQRCK